MYIVVGLGNPGRKYEHTRHNVGFDVTEILSQKYDIPIRKLMCKAAVGEGTIRGERVVIAQPQPRRLGGDEGGGGGGRHRQALGRPGGLLHP